MHTVSFFHDMADNHNVAGNGLFNKFLNLKFIPELHVPGYQYLGPFTNLEKRLNRGDQGINPLDRAARDHDIYYSKFSDTNSRNSADKQLEDAAWSRVKASDSSISEKIAAYLTTNAMKIKRHLGMGCLSKGRRRPKSKGVKRRKNKHSRQTGGNLTFGSMVKKARSSLRRSKIKNLNDNSSLKKAVQLAMKAIGSRRGVIKGLKKKDGGRIIPIPKVGGILPLIPILASISRIGALAGGASSIISAIKNILDLKKNIDTNSGSKKIGEGLFLTPYRKGYGLYLSPKNY